MVLDNVDAKQLETEFGDESLDVIVFQFPNTGDRQGIRGRNSNFVLVRDFLHSARRIISGGGRVVISAVDSPYYEGCFQFDEASQEAGYQMLGPYPFDPDDFPGYVHTNTNDDESAIETESSFATWVFVPIFNEVPA